MPTSTRTSSAIAHTQTETNTSSASTVALSTVMWVARFAVEVDATSASADTLPAVMGGVRLTYEAHTGNGIIERGYAGKRFRTYDEAHASAVTLAKLLGDAVLWVGVARIEPDPGQLGVRN